MHIHMIPISENINGNIISHEIMRVGRAQAENKRFDKYFGCDVSGCIFGGVCDTKFKFTKYQCHKIPMTTNTPYGILGAGRALAENKKHDEYFGCGVCKDHFPR